jgi:hypothetical protein
MAGCLAAVAAVMLPGAAGAAENRVAATQTGADYGLENKSVAVKWRVVDSHVQGMLFTDRLHHAELRIEKPFAILMEDGTIVDVGSARIAGEVVKHEHVPRPEAARLADRLHGEEFDVPMESKDHALRLIWTVVLLDDSNYVRQALTVAAVGKDAPIKRVELVDLAMPGAHVSGSVAGSPIVAGNLFAGLEDPLSLSRVTGERATAWMDRDLPLRAGQSITYSSVIGVAREGQMRRDFLAYLERERAHPYRTFLHYNSWYDLGYFTPFDATGALDRVNDFGRELTEKRGVKLNSFLFDDGWDNHKSLWKFNDGFPDGFTKVRRAAEKYGADPGVWMSPWGGYDKPKEERIAFGKSAGYEIVANGYALSGPKYYDAFRDVAMEMVTKYGVNQFKFDGTGNVDSVFKGSRFDSDFAAAIHLIGELRAAKPDLFINLTTGTWPSPFWLMYSDSIWRGGEDDEFAGVGSYRERWITYRDQDTYRHIVQGGPLYPLNSLMLHGMIFAKHRKHLDDDPGNDFRNEIRSYFGTGTQLQEMYITPSLLTERNWDDLAEAAKWSRANAEVLKDTHWIGGDPAWLEVYGWGSWSEAANGGKGKGILVLRNPSDRDQTIEITLQDVLELPAGVAQDYVAKSPWKDDAGHAAIALNARKAHAFRLAPFEVLTLDLEPR